MAVGLKVVGIGGAIREGSTSETALSWMMDALLSRGADISVFTGRDIDFPLFDPNDPACDTRIDRYLTAIRDCDALVIASPVYHGGPSGLLKNALDHLQPLAGDRRCYLSGRPVACVAAGGGLAGAVSTLSAMRDVVHALRGWPVPMHVPINSSAQPFDAGGGCVDPKLGTSLNAALDDLVAFASAMRRASS